MRKLAKTYQVDLKCTIYRTVSEKPPKSLYQWALDARKNLITHYIALLLPYFSVHEYTIFC